jgi:hypothetical protein
MKLAIGAQYRRWIEVMLPLYSFAVLLMYFRPQDWPVVSDTRVTESVMPWAVWGVMGAMSGVLAASGLTLAFFLLYSPLYLLARSSMLVGRGGWVDRRELRFYIACFILLCFLAGLAIVHPVAAASSFVVLAGSAHLLWRALA